MPAVQRVRLPFSFSFRTDRRLGIALVAAISDSRHNQSEFLRMVLAEDLPRVRRFASLVRLHESKRRTRRARKGRAS